MATPSAAQLEAAVFEQLRSLLRSPDLLEPILTQAQQHEPSLDEAQVTVAMIQLDTVWAELFPAEQARLFKLLIEKVVVSADSLEACLRATGLQQLARELRQPQAQIKKTAVLTASDGRVTLSVPIQIKRRGWHKVVRLPNGNSLEPQCPEKPTPLQLALARGHRWLALLESGQASNLAEVAKQVGVDSAYVSRMVNLTHHPGARYR